MIPPTNYSFPPPCNSDVAAVDDLTEDNVVHVDPPDEYGSGTRLIWWNLHALLFHPHYQNLLVVVVLAPLPDEENESDVDEAVVRFYCYQ